MSDTTTQALIVEARSETFEREVIERSRTVPVVVDFWAEWCQPCRMLGPFLETLAREYGGRFVLVKADTERLGDIAAAFGVRSIPAVFGLRDGQVYDSFVGALPESAIRAWIDRLLPSPAERLASEARGLESDAPAEAEAKYREALALMPGDPRAQTGLARVLVARGQVEEADALLADLESRGFLDGEAEKVRAELTLKVQARAAGGVEAARAAAADRPGDLSLRLKLAEALAAAGSHIEALDLCLELIEADRKGVGEEARQTMLRIFQLLPPDSEVVNDYRRKLLAALY